ncbi:right-handed parallel beta-helix repeat-containing protein [Aquabacterium sp.]|uniref:right-handed parallel beta-helix repeat-containing protein n=1 Tax=Aquabacterium sp. TaxID=1872578 RepID=UPI003BB1542B
MFDNESQTVTLPDTTQSASAPRLTNGHLHALLAVVLLGTGTCWAAAVPGEPSSVMNKESAQIDVANRLERLTQSLSLSVRHHLKQGHEVTALAVRQLGKGQQAFPLPQQTYALDGRPQPTSTAALRTMPAPRPQLASGGRSHLVKDGAALQRATLHAQAGDTILLAPGIYVLRSRLSQSQDGRSDAPITVRAQRPGEVRLQMSGGTIHQTHAYWIYENLTIEGHCGPRGQPCEHAFHVVGAARHVVIRNNLIRNFSAHIKVNGENGQFPDGGLFQFNTLSNDTALASDILSPFDLVGASHWVVADNQVSHFIKASSHYPSYGLFMKGGGAGGRIERNLVMCAIGGDVSHGGSRVGISLGGGLTGPRFCPDGRCLFEHKGGVIRNNVIVDCNDVGIDNNRATQSVIAHNTVIRTLGIGLRATPSDATVYGNVVDGPIQARQGSTIKLDHNHRSDARQFPSGWQSPPARIPTHSLVSDDFCGRPRPATTLPGAFHQAGGCQDVTPAQ